MPIRAIVSAPTARELRCYVEWARELITMANDEVLVRVVDQALSDYFKRDRLWRPIRQTILADHDSREWREKFSAMLNRKEDVGPR